MGKSYKCKSFDHITKIAVNKGLEYVNRTTIWNNSSKLQGKRKRKNPNILYTKVSGIWSLKNPDTLEMPKPGKKVDKKASGKGYVYVVPASDLFLHLRILKDDFKPIPDNTEYSLEITKPDWTKHSTGWKAPAKKEHPNITNGVIKVKIPPTAQEGTLTVRLKAEDTDKSGGSGGGQKANRGEVPVIWDLKIGALNPIGELAPDKNCTSGVQQRLNNLRFNSGPVDGRLGNKTKAAVAAFQSFFNINVPKGKEDKPDQIHAKLEEVHDTDKEVSVPGESGRIKGPSTDVSKKKKRPTSKKNIGHVAPSYGEFTNCNTFVIRPEYRISLRIGKIEDLFLHKLDSQKGRMERMQVVGLFYFPMNHKKAEDAIKFGWKYYKEQILKENEDTKAFEKLAERIQNFVVDGGELPPPADDFNKPEVKNFKKLRFPGGYTCTDCKSVWSVFNPNHDDTTGWDPNDLKRGKPYKLGMLKEQVYDAELAHKHDNPVLGAIPLVALVEKRSGADGEWKPVKDVMVYFQLVMPYKLPDYDKTKDPRRQINRPDLRESDMQKKTKTGVGPKKLVDAAMDKEPPTKKGDPQADNCPEKHGGKRGLSVADNIFELKADLADHKRQIAKVPVHDWKPRPGFHAEHEDEPRKSQVKGPFFPLPEKAPVIGEKHKYAVRAETNEKGEAGVIFKPSTVGGDRYRIRAYVGPDTLTGAGSDGEGAQGVRVETGTLVVWRNIRISKVSRMPCTTLAPALQTDIKTQFKGSASGWRKDLFDKPLETLKDMTSVTKKDAKRTSVGLPKLDLSAEGDPKPRSHYKGLVYQMARSFCELELDPGIDPNKPATDLSEKEWRDALEAAVKCADNNMPKKKNISVTNSGLEIDVAKFVITDKSVKASNSFAAIPLRMPKVYNGLVDSTFPKLPVNAKNELREGINGPGDIGRWYLEYLVFPFVYALAHDGYLPGLFILQVTSISTLGVTRQIFDFTGLGLQFRSCVLAHGDDYYAPEPKVQYRDTAKKHEKCNTGYSALALHEVGHCLFRDHAPPTFPIPDPHDKKDDGYCVMSYEMTEGDYCGKCVLAVQGWKDIKTLP